MAASIAGFWATAAAFDERIAVVVTARDLPRGHVLSATDLAPAQVMLGDVPHIAWTPSAPETLAGLAVGHALPAGSLVGTHLLVEPSIRAFGDALEVVVPLDTSLAPSGVREGDVVLLVDPGAAPSRERAGRPRSVIRTLDLAAFDGSAMRLFVPPAQWVWWRALPGELGAPPMALPVPLGGDAAALAADLDELWAASYSQETAALQPFGGQWRDQAAPGELEVLTPVDLSLAPSGIAQGDLALLIDPGAPRGSADGGRPRSVIRAVRLEHYEDGVLGVWAQPAEWVWWKSLPQQLGAAPMVLRVPPGTDTDAVAEQLNNRWQQAWEQG
ncbi:SAF domain-containing protein [Candidatus Poriferisodalis sp.]|uniref:SAF domain-containing protein n=1 Tax=Candidatus Poriferisodalis sp. TaxID=3101277 RepID=UPI003D0E2363